jgi:uncharacterized protein (DUF1786 family)
MSVIAIADADRVRVCCGNPPFGAEIVVGDSYGGGIVLLTIRKDDMGMSCYMTVDEAREVRDLLNKALRYQGAQRARLMRKSG